MRKIKAVAALALFISCFCFCSFAETHYTRETKVIKVEHNIVTVVDKNNYLWRFEADDFAVDDDVKLIMDTNHTDTIFDDIIIKPIKQAKK